jgi:ribonuclease BN (tRNA processing enzyme)
MKLLLLGTAGYHPSETRQTACMMLPEAGIVLDAGTGFFRVREHLQTSTLDILLTHAHLDHVVGLTYLLSTVWERKLERITVHGEEAKLAAIREHLLAETLFPAPLPIEWRSLRKAADELPHSKDAFGSGGFCVLHGSPKPVCIRWYPLAHPGGSVGYTLDWSDRCMAYVTDTTASADAPYVESIRGVDLLVHECNFRDREQEWAIKTGHSCTSAVAAVAKQASVKRLVLLHFNPLDDSDDPVDLAAARAILPATDLGHDGMSIEF